MLGVPGSCGRTPVIGVPTGPVTVPGVREGASVVTGSGSVYNGSSGVTGNASSGS